MCRNLFPWKVRVALRKESVDRNSIALASFRACIVALRKESVDRNTNPGSTTLTFPVALRKESVDRNIALRKYPVILGKSLSARRAWIEIAASRPKNSPK